MATEFDLLTAVSPRGDGRYHIDVPDGWQQGRGAFGGLVLAYLVRAGEATIGDDQRLLRSLTAEIVGPVLPGAAEVEVEILRAGSGVTTAAARLVQNGEVQAHAVLACGRPRAAYELAPVLAPPPLPPWRELPVAPMGGPPAPTFTQHVEFRLDGPLPFSASKEVEVRGWVRFRAPGRDRGSPYLVAVADSFWPSILVASAVPRPMATLAFSFQRIDGNLGLDADAPLYYRGRVLAARDGYAMEQRELWGEDGRLVALNHQTFAIIA
jgi:acyl-CoA thioesterase